MAGPLLWQLSLLVSSSANRSGVIPRSSKSQRKRNKEVRYVRWSNSFYDFWDSSHMWRSGSLYLNCHAQERRLVDLTDLSERMKAGLPETGLFMFFQKTSLGMGTSEA